MNTVIVYEQGTEVKRWLETIDSECTCVDVSSQPLRQIKKIERLVLVCTCTSFGIGANMLRLCTFLERKLSSSTEVKVVLFFEDKPVDVSGYINFFKSWGAKAGVQVKNFLCIFQSLVLYSPLKGLQKRKLVHTWKEFSEGTANVHVTFMPTIAYSSYVNTWVKDTAKIYHMEDHLEETDKYFVYLSRERG